MLPAEVPLREPLSQSATSAAPGERYLVVNDHGVAIAPAVLDRLERLDDALFGALDGNGLAFEEFVSLWHEAVREDSAEQLEESRQHYLRHAKARRSEPFSDRLLMLLADEACDTSVA